MLTLIVTILFGIAFAFFATQNVDTTSLHLGIYNFSGIPLYLVILGSMLLGILISGIITGLNALATFFSIRGKDVKIQEIEQETRHLKEKIRLLELENARLKGQPVKEEKVRFYDRGEAEDSRPNILSRIRQSFP